MYLSYDLRIRLEADMLNITTKQNAKIELKSRQHNQ